MMLVALIVVDLLLNSFVHLIVEIVGHFAFYAHELIELWRKNCYFGYLRNFEYYLENYVEFVFDLSLNYFDLIDIFVVDF